MFRFRPIKAKFRVSLHPSRPTITVFRSISTSRHCTRASGSIVPTQRIESSTRTRILSLPTRKPKNLTSGLWALVKGLQIRLLGEPRVFEDKAAKGIFTNMCVQCHLLDAIAASMSQLVRRLIPGRKRDTTPSRLGVNLESTRHGMKRSSKSRGLQGRSSELHP